MSRLPMRWRRICNKRHVLCMRKDAPILPCSPEATLTLPEKFGGCCRMLRSNMPCSVEVGRFIFHVGKNARGDARAR